MTLRHRSLGIAAIAVSVLGWPAAGTAQEAPADAGKILETAGIERGMILHLGCGDGKLTAALRTGDHATVRGLDPDGKNVRAAREHIRSLGLYGMVSVDLLSGDRLPCVDNLVSLLVSEDLGGVSMDEVMRVLAPLGVAVVKRDGRWTRTVKPLPGEIDEWPQHFHGPDNNAMARDRVVGPPRRFQWIVRNPRSFREIELMEPLKS